MPLTTAVSRFAVVMVATLVPACAIPWGSAPACESELESEIAARPTFTPFHVRPELRNEAGFRRALERKAASAGLEVQGGGEIWVLVAAEGCVIRTQLRQSTGSRPLDRLILAHWLDARYTPALIRRGGREGPTDAWIAEPVPE